MRRLALLGIVLGCASCTDFGFMADRFEEPDSGQADAGEAGDGAAPCVEGAAAPSATGAQVRFITLNVDNRLLTVKVGDLVTWTNGDTMTHTVTQGVPGAAQGIDSGDIAPGSQWAYRFCSKRSYVYFCKSHPAQMNGYRIVVEE